MLGAPGIVNYKLLPDRMHVVTRDTQGDVCKWSILHGVKVQTFPPGSDFDHVVRGWQISAGKSQQIPTRVFMSHLLVVLFCPLRLNIQVEELARDKVARPSWCSIDVRVGSLTVHMTENEASWSCKSFTGQTFGPGRPFSIFVFGLSNFFQVFSAWALVQPQSTDDTRFNLGASVIQALLRPWQETFRFTEYMQERRDAGTSAENVKVCRMLGRKESKRALCCLPPCD